MGDTSELLSRLEMEVARLQATITTIKAFGEKATPPIRQKVKRAIRRLKAAPVKRQRGATGPEVVKAAIGIITTAPLIGIGGNDALNHGGQLHHMVVIADTDIIEILDQWPNLKKVVGGGCWA